MEEMKTKLPPVFFPDPWKYRFLGSSREQSVSRISTSAAETVPDVDVFFPPGNMTIFCFASLRAASELEANAGVGA